MRVHAYLVATAVALSGCTTAQLAGNPADLPNMDTRALCRTAAENPDQEYRFAAIKLLQKRGATVQKCRSLIEADNAIMTGIAVAGAAAAAGAAASDGYGGGYYAPSRYGVAWDQFPNGQWRCRDKGNGQFVDDSYCAGQFKYDHW